MTPGADPLPTDPLPTDPLPAGPAAGPARRPPGASDLQSAPAVAEPSAELAAALRGYLDHLAVERGVARNTLLSYRRDLQRYLGFLAGAGRTRLDEVTSTDVSDFLVALRTGSPEHPPLAASSAARAVVAARGWHRFLLAEGTVATDASRDVHPPVPARRLPKALPVATITALLEAADGQDPRGLRDRALLELLYATGARISEAVGLDVDDVDALASAESTGAPPGVSVVRLRGKGAKERLVPVGSFAVQALHAYLVRGRPALAAARTGRSTRSPAGALFLNVRGSAAVPAERLAGPAGHRRAGRHQRLRRCHRRLPAHPAALVRDPPARGRCGRAVRAGTAGACIGDDDADLHPGDGRFAARGLRHLAPEGALTTSRCSAR